VKFRVGALIVGCCSLGLLRAVAAADPPVDDGLLEFLGSVDSDDKDWRDYLAGSDADPVARRVGSAPPPSKPAVPAPAAGTPAAADPPAAGAPPPVSYP
jgi:hypothetical protein